jgi:hypothetical protein
MSTSLMASTSSNPTSCFRSSSKNRRVKTAVLDVEHFVMLTKNHEPVRARHGQRLNYDRACEREHRRVRAQRHGQGHDRDQCEGRPSSQRSKRVMQILENPFEVAHVFENTTLQGKRIRPTVPLGDRSLMRVVRYLNSPRAWRLHRLRRFEPAPSAEAAVIQAAPSPP